MHGQWALALLLSVVVAPVPVSGSLLPCEVAEWQTWGDAAAQQSTLGWSCRTPGLAEYRLPTLPAWLSAVRHVFAHESLAGVWLLVNVSTADAESRSVPAAAVLSVLTGEDAEAAFPAAAALGGGSVARSGGAAAGVSLGAASALVVRTIWNDTSATYTAAELAANVFDDAANARSQFQACSAGRFTLARASGASIVNGVVDVEVRHPLQGRALSEVRLLALDALRAALGAAVVSEVRFVLFSVPSGSVSDQGGSWYATSELGGNLSYYNDVGIVPLATQMYCLGRNLGLPKNDAGDSMGYMGPNLYAADAPLKCFNPAKTFQLGWFSDCTVTLDALSGLEPTLLRLPGVAEFDESVNCSVSPSRAMTVRVMHYSSDSFQDNSLYIGYNRATGANVGTETHPDRLTLVSAEDLRAVPHQAGPSFLVDGLSPGTDRVTGRVRVTFCNVDANGDANVVLTDAGMVVVECPMMLDDVLTC